MNSSQSKKAKAVLADTSQNDPFYSQKGTKVAEIQKIYFFKHTKQNNNTQNQKKGSKFKENKGICKRSKIYFFTVKKCGKEQKSRQILLRRQGSNALEYLECTALFWIAVLYKENYLIFHQQSG